jgi:TonB family protein
MTRGVVLALFMFSCGTSAFSQSSEDTLLPKKAVAIYAPPPMVPAEAREKHLAGNGVCVLYVRPDGTVSHVEIAKSTGQPLLDKASTDAFSRWRFRPNSITKAKVRIPITYTGNYSKPPKT